MTERKPNELNNNNSELSEQEKDLIDKLNKMKEEIHEANKPFRDKYEKGGKYFE